MRSAALGLVIAVATFRTENGLQSAQARIDPKFEVASIKPNTSDSDRHFYPAQAGGLVRLIDVPLVEIIQVAYKEPPDQLIGPDWINQTRYDILAKTYDGQPFTFDGVHSIRPMLRTLLEERFQLTAHHETRLLPKYALVRAKADGSLGPQLRSSGTDCEAILAERAKRPVGTAIVVPAPGTPCTLAGFGRTTVADSVTLESLIGGLNGGSGTERLVDRGIVDQTGLTGRFSYTLTLDPSVSIFTLIEEQLGLKLQAIRAAVDVLVIDHVEHPTEN